MRQIVRALKKQHARLDRRGLIALVALLWRMPVFERRMVAVLLLEAFQPLLRPADMRLLERLIHESKTWAFVDELAIAIVGPLVERSSELLRVLDRWATDDDFWIRRSAMLALLRPDLVYQWLLPRCAVASGVTVREAVKYLSSRQRADVLDAYASARGR